MTKTIVLYLHVHQPYRLRHYTVFDCGVDHNYFNGAISAKEMSNESIIRKVVEKSYIPANQRLLKLLQDHPEFKLNLSLTGTVIEQLERWAPEALESFKA